ncbi:putative ABC transport system permease protein [Silvibacterium bohemicum]|uniref:Putative ABC transport system permease protein n=1 Tax=Silvibacterium bohemicum TaxID=1577686 RepID=A0A841K1V7_9BACT|nr:FtsX-like permease family protein [Silvibacterium bohemicum]MBB6145161.1 putative ABC transport system permease protein [Silvibacterium bohemicum]
MATSHKPALPWSTAARIARRELRASQAKFVFVLLSVAIGVASLTGVRGFSQSFQKALLGDARSLMAADLSARMFRIATAKEVQELDALATKGVQRTEVTETVSMASVHGDPVPLLVSLKAVDPASYPYYGTIVLQPDSNLRDVLNDDTAVVDDNLLVRLNAKVGNQLKIGNRFFRIAAVLVREPDRMSAGVGLGPRVMITRHAMLLAGLLGEGSRASERYLFRLNGKNQDIANIRPELEKILPDAQIMDFRETSPELTNGLDHATGLLSLICLVAMVLGAIGVAMAMRAHLQQRMEILAIMKSIGARSSDILRIYLLQTVFLGLAGGLIGVAFGFGVEYVFPWLLGSLLPLRPPLELAIRPMAAALATGVLTTLLFCLPPLLDVRRIRPIAVLRKMVETSDGTGSPMWSSNQAPSKSQRIVLLVVLAVGLALLAIWMIGRAHHTPHPWALGGLALDIAIGLAAVFYGWWGPKFKERKLQWGAIVIILAGLAGIAAALSDSWLIGRWFAGSLFAVLLVILALSAVTLRALHAFLDKTRLHLPSALRHGLANLYRPGNQSSSVLAALGTGVMLILAVFLMQGAVVREMHTATSPDTPNMFLVDIAPDELEGARTLIEKQPGVQSKLETIPVISSRILSIDGVGVDALKVQNYPKRLLRSAAITWSSTVPRGAKIAQGKWWSNDAAPDLAVVDHVAERLHLHIGSRVEFGADDRTITTTVSAIYKVDGEHAFARSEFILAPDLLKGLPATWYGAVHVAPNQVAAMERTLFAAYPTVTVINLADILETIQGVVDHITLVIRFLAGFSILSGAIILASSVASTRFRRIREVVVLKTLGATRGRIAQVFSVEFMVLGLLSGLVGAIFANLLARVLLHKMDVVFRVDWAGSAVAIVATAVLATATGWVASFRLLGQKPLEVLREE